MKDLIVYYSLEGNTEYVVDKIKAVTGADCLCLHPLSIFLNCSKFFLLPYMDCLQQSSLWEYCELQHFLHQ